MTDINKKVSVVMCTYNGEKYLREQIDSILSQTYPIYELLIQDDLSTDSTLDILSEYEARYSFVKVLRNKKNMGVPQNFKSIFFQATGEYIVVSDQDDIWLCNKIECMLKAIGNNLLITSASYSIVQEYENSILDSVALKTPDAHFLPLRYVSLQATLSGHDMLFHKDLLSYIPEIFWRSFWYDFCLAIVAIGLNRAVYLDLYLTIWRRHVNAFTYCENSRQRRCDLKGLVSIFFNKRQRKLLGQFYCILSPVLKSNAKALSYARFMESGAIFKACLYTLKHKTDFVDKSVPILRSLIRAFLIPAFTYRNIKNWNSMYLNESTGCPKENL